MHALSMHAHNRLLCSNVTFTVNRCGKCNIYYYVAHYVIVAAAAVCKRSYRVTKRLIKLLYKFILFILFFSILKKASILHFASQLDVTLMLMQPDKFMEQWTFGPQSELLSSLIFFPKYCASEQANKWMSKRSRILGNHFE